MTLSTVFAVIAVMCSLAGLAVMAVGHWSLRRQTRPVVVGGRHRHPMDARARRVRDTRGQLFPGPTRAQLRSEAATR